MSVVAAIRNAARRAPDVVGSPFAFLAACGATILWVLVGPLFDFSEGWLVFPATATSIGAFLIVLLIQYSQNRDTRAVQLKLDELIRGLAEARTDLVRLEHRSDEEIEALADEFTRLQDEAAAPPEGRDDDAGSAR